MPLSPTRQKSLIFCGSGDSLAACMLAEAFSGYVVRAADPLDLLKNTSIPKGHDVYIVSISGRTISNIKVAKLGKKSVAITSNPSSRLAKSCHDVILLDFPNSDVITAGSTSFLNSALVCISLVYDVVIKSPQKIFDLAVKQAKKTQYRNRVFFLGDLHTYPVAMYAAAKMYEVLGYNAYYERIEQFSHMELFSAKRGDTVVIFEPKTKHNTRLVHSLKKAGLHVVQPDPQSTSKITQFIFFTFFAQLVPLLMAKSSDQKECYFMTAKKLRQASDDMIY